MLCSARALLAKHKSASLDKLVRSMHGECLILTNYCLAADAEQYTQDKIYLTDEMLYPPQSAMHFSEDDTDRNTFGNKLHNSFDEDTPLHPGHRKAFTPENCYRYPSLKDIFAKENARLQAWALRSQTFVPSSLKEQLGAKFETSTSLDFCSGETSLCLSIANLCPLP